MDDFTTAQLAITNFIKSTFTENRGDKFCKKTEFSNECHLGMHVESIKNTIGSIIYGGHVLDRWDQRCVEAALHLAFHIPCNKNPSVYDDLGLNALEVKHLPTSFIGCNESISAIPALDTSRLIGISGGSTRLQIYTKGILAFDILRVVTSKKSEHMNSKRTYASAEDSAIQTIALKYLQGLRKY